MSARAVGLDIGTFAVRAAEVALGDEPTLLRFGQVTLPPGAVRDGDVVDPAAVAAAIRRLWREAGFKSKAVVTGLASVIVRTADLPYMLEGDVASALQFEAQELIPIPIEDAILDYQVLEQVEPGNGAGDGLTRVLLAAAQRDVVRSNMAAIEGAGLRPLSVDPVPFALIRSLYRPDPAEAAAPTTAEAIVSVGGGVTTVVVHERGVPRFVRVLVVGGDDVTDALARELDVDLDTAEDLKRRADTAADDPVVAQAGRLVQARLTPMLDEIRGSLEYYLAQAQSAPIARVLVTGGASRTQGFVQRLQQQLGERIEVARPLAGVRVGQLGLTDEQLAQIEPLVSVPLGLALGASFDRKTTVRRRINLLPGEVAASRAQRQQAIGVVGAVAGLSLLLLLLWLNRGRQLADAREDADEREAEVAALQQQVQALSGITRLQADVNERREEVVGVLEGDVDWTRLVNEVATIIPTDVWLTSFTASAGAEGAGSVTFNLQGIDHTSTARWILRASELRSLAGLWVPGSSRGGGQGDLGLASFSSSATLTPAAESDRARRFEESS